MSQQSSAFLGFWDELDDIARETVALEHVLLKVESVYCVSTFSFAKSFGQANAEELDSAAADLLSVVKEMIDLTTERFPVDKTRQGWLFLFACEPGVLSSCVSNSIQGFTEEDAHNLIDTCNTAAASVDEIIQLVRTAAVDSSVFPQLAVSRKVLAQCLQSILQIAVEGNENLLNLVEDSVPKAYLVQPQQSKKPLPPLPRVFPERRQTIDLSSQGVCVCVCVFYVVTCHSETFI
jgi:hypothetical protein